ncbi:hypothetical protein FZX04_02005 [Listeria monocytogenes]|uniref:DUF6037 family protein n=1 Tax=Listeria monocytogenes TaxID=1639 RepID=UPI00086B864D|nr:DUF6037 family protein [Listeria monocytogenes]EAG6774568.1 hypothetical protein [Listeria monocytogenes]EHW1482458.1 hypothetical protein [Listeria monocytogenes]OEP32285.1 hypothetical protein AJM39_09475 [Listeria monocytogenes]OFE60274.1 hypothetical protein AJL47_05205 [Listeria monocytogenes]TYU14167.1 hypothetical protein FZW82_04715 [Listeria monocytogenes]
MILENFKPLFTAMNKDGERRQRFTIEYNGVRVHILFLADLEPFLLMFGIQDTNEYFELEMNRNFEVSSFFAKDLYRKLIDIFNIRYDPNHKFTPNDFLDFVNNNVPNYRYTEKIENSDVLKYKRYVEDSDKIYFCGWIYHTTKSNAQSSNLNKTRILLGEAAYNRCCERNISSKWTDLVEKRIELDLELFLS